jgi:hypothetical protein
MLTFSSVEMPPGWIWTTKVNLCMSPTLRLGDHQTLIAGVEQLDDQLVVVRRSAAPADRLRVDAHGGSVTRLCARAQLADLLGEPALGGVAEAKTRAGPDALTPRPGAEDRVALGERGRDAALDHLPALLAEAVAVADLKLPSGQR